MRLPPYIERTLQREDVNFALTNRIPRRLLTRFMGWFSRIEQPLVRDLSIAAFALFAGDLRLFEAKKKTFRSLHDCFIRELREGARPIRGGAEVLVSPCDAIVGAFGMIEGGELLQVKGSRYSLADLLQDPDEAERFGGGTYVTLRLASGMYHRFHAPCEGRVTRVTHIPGDLWNVNPIALGRIPRLYCRNERVAIAIKEERHARVTLVAVGAVLVGSVRLSFMDLSERRNGGEYGSIACDKAVRQGGELGYFHHGSTIVVLATRPLIPCEHLRGGEVVRMGDPLLHVGLAPCGRQGLAAHAVRHSS